MYSLKQIQLVTQGINDQEQMLFDDGESFVRTETFMAIRFEREDTFDCCVLGLKKRNEGEYSIGFFIKPHKLINPDLLRNDKFQVRLKVTRLEEDGKLYQLLITRMTLEDEDGEKKERVQDDVFFTKNGEKERVLMKEMLRIFNEKSRIVVHKQPAETFSRGSIASSSMDGKRPSAISELLLKPQ